MEILKASRPTEYVEIFEYLKDVPEAILCDLGTFIIMCDSGRQYIAKVDDIIVGVLCMYEVANHVFVAHMHLESKYRRSKIALSLYREIVRYAKDKKKKAYTTMEDVRLVKNSLVEAGTIDSGETLYEIDTDRGARHE